MKKIERRERNKEKKIINWREKQIRVWTRPKLGLRQRLKKNLWHFWMRGKQRRKKKK